MFTTQGLYFLDMSLFKFMNNMLKETCVCKQISNNYFPSSLLI